jgi:Domain of unknown function (DUF4189)
VDRWPFTNWKRLARSIARFLGGGAFMTCFGRALTGVIAAASLLIGATAVGKAAGALAIGACGAYGFAYDYAQEPPRRPRSASARAAARSSRCGGPAAQSPSTPAMPAAPTGYAVAARLGQAQNAALRHCYQYGGKDCVIRAWACDAKD